MESLHDLDNQSASSTQMVPDKTSNFLGNWLNELSSGIFYLTILCVNIFLIFLTSIFYKISGSSIPYYIFIIGLFCFNIGLLCSRLIKEILFTQMNTRYFLNQVAKFLVLGSLVHFLLIITFPIFYKSIILSLSILFLALLFSSVFFIFIFFLYLFTVFNEFFRQKTEKLNFLSLVVFLFLTAPLFIFYWFAILQFKTLVSLFLVSVFVFLLLYCVVLLVAFFFGSNLKKVLFFLLILSGLIPWFTDFIIFIQLILKF